MLFNLKGYFNHHPQRIKQLKKPQLYKIRSTDMLTNLCPIPEGDIQLLGSRNNDICRRRCA